MDINITLEGLLLGALAIGYAIGGRIADRRPSYGLLYAMIAVGGLLALVIAPAASPAVEMGTAKPTPLLPAWRISSSPVWAVSLPTPSATCSTVPSDEFVE